jgi:diketogulonate reductase-like aldo/keto reductase
MNHKTLQINGVTVPRFLYGTAWKEADTERLTALALKQGFRGIDTANQRKHYHEAAAGEAVKQAITAGQLRREDLFLQTKYTSIGGQDHRLPYDPKAPVATQVEQSFASSLEHFNTDVIDSYVLHGPTVRSGLASADWEAWRAMEKLHAAGKSRLLGVSNVSREQLELLCSKAQVKPHFVQNRCYASRGWDRDVRSLCADQAIVYQGFSLLTANRDAQLSLVVQQIAKRHNRTPSQIIFRFALDVGMVPLTGTTSAKHMQEDLAVFDFELDPAEVTAIESAVA